MFSGNRSIRQALLSCDILDMSNSGKLYQKVPLWLFRGIQRLSLAGTTISSKANDGSTEAKNIRHRKLQEYFRRQSSMRNINCKVCEV